MKRLKVGEYCFNEVFERLKEHLDIKTQVHLAQILGVKHQTIAEAKRKTGIFPVKWAAVLSAKFDTSLDFILTGEEKKDPRQEFYKKILIVTEQENAELRVQLKEQQFLLDKKQSK